MKLVIDKIGTTTDICRTVLDLDKVCVMRLEDSDGGFKGGNAERLQVSFEDGFSVMYLTDDCKFYLVSNGRGVAKPRMDEVTAADVINTFMTT